MKASCQTEKTALNRLETGMNGDILQRVIVLNRPQRAAEILPETQSALKLSP